MIELDKVSKWFGAFQVLKDCTTRVDKGEVVVVCGPSGSGKSTLIKTINGLEPFQQGEIRVDGVSVNDPKTNLSTLRARIGMVFQNFELFPHLSVRENLTIAQIKPQISGPGRLDRAAGQISGAVVRWTAAAGGDCARSGDGPDRHAV